MSRNAKQPNRILTTPTTPAACAGDLRTPAEQVAAAGAARTQLANTRMNAADQAAVKGGSR